MVAERARHGCLIAPQRPALRRSKGFKSMLSLRFPVAVMMRGAHAALSAPLSKVKPIVGMDPCEVSAQASGYLARPKPGCTR